MTTWCFIGSRLGGGTPASRLQFPPSSLNHSTSPVHLFMMSDPSSSSKTIFHASSSFMTMHLSGPSLSHLYSGNQTSPQLGIDSPVADRKFHRVGNQLARELHDLVRVLLRLYYRTRRCKVQLTHSYIPTSQLSIAGVHCATGKRTFSALSTMGSEVGASSAVPGVFTMFVCHSSRPIAITSVTSFHRAPNVILTLCRAHATHLLFPNDWFGPLPLP